MKRRLKKTREIRKNNEENMVGWILEFNRVVNKANYGRKNWKSDF